MLTAAAAQSWNVPASEITIKAGTITHKQSGKSAHFGEFASLAATMPVPEEVQLKDSKDFGIIGSSKKNVEAKVNKRSNYKPKAGVASVDELKELAAGQAAEGFLK
jgi:isoquinoline 1-oxidoreductase beta subunit